jgi:hypothetical protein
MNPAFEFFRSLQRVAVTIVLAAAAFVAVLVAWWLALLLLFGLGLWLGVRRLFAAPKPPRAGATVIEGEFEKVEEPPERLR